MSTRIETKLSPTAGFCVKSTVQQATVLNLATKENVLEPRVLPVPVGLKVFVNIAYDGNVPPPPEGNEEAIQRAMRGEDDADKPDPGAWFVPVVVSPIREDKDKAGKPSLVLDCVYNSSIRSRILRDPLFKTFIIELALQRIEDSSPLVLSRQISTPNIASKGKLLPRNAFLPTFLNPATQPLIEEIETVDPPKSFLKVGAAEKATKSRPKWNWRKTEDNRLELTVVIPSLTHDIAAKTTLDMEPRRLRVVMPSVTSLDINLGISDAEIVATSGGAHDSALTLKRQRPFDVDGASAEWRVAEGVLVLSA